MRVVAFAPGRANLIGEHTDYNDGLSLPFAIEQGVRVSAEPGAENEVLARALDLGEEQRFPITGAKPDPAHRSTGGWSDFVRGTIGELTAAGFALRGAALEITGDVPQGAGLSSSAAIEVALSLALLAVAGIPAPADRIALARLCSRVENDWVGAHTGLLDQLASLCGERDHALRIDFRTLEIRPVPLRLGDWTLVTAPSGETHSLADSGYNERREETERARLALGLGLESLRDARPEDLARLPGPLDRRVRHVIEENARVEATVAALEAGDLAEVGRLLDASHASLRDLYDSSTDAVERTVARLREAGAVGARMMGGGFGGDVLALFPPGAAPPEDAHAVAPAAGARLLDPA
ncbi:MAG TPA: galactokinase [Solirubrobacteraceae bacterium]|nr:galactokinase [Solirubrobacteraceae bacterium]